MFRGNPTRTFHGSGPLPDGVDVLWQFPDKPMCGVSPLGGVDKVWCGSGWTGQPVVWDRPDGITEVIFGAYDNIIARKPKLGHLLRGILQGLEHSPAQFFGLSHFWVVEKN